VQFLPSQAGIRQQITDVLALREAWLEVERAEKASVRSAAAPASTEPVHSLDRHRSRSGTCGLAWMSIINNDCNNDRRQ